MGGPRTERPTRRRLREARERGLVAHSPALSGTVVLLAGAVGLFVGGAALVDALLQLGRRTFEVAAVSGAGQATEALTAGVMAGMAPLLPVLGVLFLAGFLVSLAQVGPVFAPNAIRPDLARLRPRLVRVVSAERLCDTLVAMLVTGVVVGVTAWLLVANLGAWVRLGEMGVEAALGVVTRFLRVWGSWALGLMLPVGLVDLLWRRHRRSRRLMMTREEVLQERREVEGEPVYRGERSRIHRELLAFDLVRALRQASLVVADPGGAAAALYYDEAVVEAPELVAKGRGHAAGHLVRLAERLNVPVVRQPELALRLQRLGVGRRVPESLYVPVAEALAAAERYGS